MGESSGEVKIEYGDDMHPRELFKLLKHKRKQLKLVLKGKFKGFTDEEKANYSAMSHEQIHHMTEQYTVEIDHLKKELRSQGKYVSHEMRNVKRNGQSYFRYSRKYGSPSVKPVMRNEQPEHNKKEESEDL